jgi:hypothetical protein
MNSEAILSCNRNVTHPDSSRISAAFNYARTRIGRDPPSRPRGTQPTLSPAPASRELREGCPTRHRSAAAELAVFVARWSRGLRESLGTTLDAVEHSPFHQEPRKLDRRGEREEQRLEPRRIRTRLISLVVSASTAFRSHAQLT